MHPLTHQLVQAHASTRATVRAPDGIHETTDASSVACLLHTPLELLPALLHANACQLYDVTQCFNQLLDERDT